MKNYKASFTKTAYHLLLGFGFLVLSIQSYSQELKFFSKGDPDKWNIEITPFLILPWVSGNIQSERLSTDYGIDPADFVTSLNGTFMINTELSKGKFFMAPSYIYNYNEVEKILWTSDNGNQSISLQPEYQRHILEVNGGMRFRLGTKFILDPYAGFRYTHYRLFGEVKGIADVHEIEEKVDFWDPVIGFKAHYYPHPRIPVELKADVGGFGAGSELTWSAWLNSGYTISQVVDLIAGFGSLSNHYKSETDNERTFGMNSVTYGITLGARFFLPGRGRDPNVFKKFKK